MLRIYEQSSKIFVDAFSLEAFKRRSRLFHSYVAYLVWTWSLKDGLRWLRWKHLVSRAVFVVIAECLPNNIAPAYAAMARSAMWSLLMLSSSSPSSFLRISPFSLARCKRLMKQYEVEISDIASGVYISWSPFITDVNLRILPSPTSADRTNTLESSEVFSGACGSKSECCC